MAGQEKIIASDPENVLPEHQVPVDAGSLGEIAVRRTTSIVDPIGYMRQRNPQRAYEM